MPVLSELIAEVKPSVSTDGRSLTMAFLLGQLDAAERQHHLDTVGSAERDGRDGERDRGVEQHRRTTARG